MRPILHRYGDMAPQILDAGTWTRKERWKKERNKLTSLRTL